MARTMEITSQRKTGIGHVILGFKRACTIFALNAGKWPRIVRKPKKLIEHHRFLGTFLSRATLAKEDIPDDVRQVFEECRDTRGLFSV